MQKIAPQSFYESVRLDPLFAAEGMDLERGAEALEAFRDALCDIQSHLGRDSYKLKLFFLTHPLHRYLYPLSFLRRFIESERCRRRFLAHPTMQNAERLLSAWRDTARSYAADASRHRKLHETALRKDKVLREKKAFFDMVGNSFTLADVFAQLALIEKNATKLKREVAERTSLLYTGTAYIPPSVSSGPQEAPPRSLSRIESFMAGINRERHVEESIIIEEYGPIGYVLPNFDGVATERQFFVYLLQNRATKYTFLRVEPADRFYFLPIGTDSPRFGWIGKAVFQSAIDRGAKYWMQTGTRFYTQRDLRFWMDVATLADKRRRPHLDWTLVDKQRSSMLDYALMTGVEEVGLQIVSAKVRNHFGTLQAYPLGAALLAHGHTSLYHLPFNGSVWRIAEKGNFVGSGRYGEGESMHEPMERVFPLVTEDMLRQMIRGGMNRVKVWREQGIL